MADSTIPKFFDAEVKPPRGGWHYFYRPEDGSTMFRGSSPDGVIEEVMKYRRNNGVTPDRAAIEVELWNYWCSLDPTRCGQEAVEPSARVAYLPRDQKPEFFGPIIWRFLNLAATRFDETGRDFFLQTVGAVFGLMSCPDCRSHWVQLLEQYNPTVVLTKKQACEWVNRVHNLVNARTGKPEYPYSKMVTEYGAPV